ncbi:MAG: hypothetical protein L0221_06715 [Chloroflexi bacterium]|nr:hypothetical protein [Chloroflexota bacterium]
MTRRLIVVVAAVWVLGCGGGLTRDQAIELASKQLPPSAAPIELVSATSGPWGEASESGGRRLAWAVEFRGAFEGEGVAPNPPPILHSFTVFLDFQTGAFVSSEGE